MSAITEEIMSIEKELHGCLDTNSPIDVVKLKRLCDLRDSRLVELVNTHEKRLEIMKSKTHELTAKLASLDFTLKPELQEQILLEQEKYDVAAISWVNDGSLVPWEESQASSIAAGILILANS